MPRIVALTLSYPPFRRIGAELATHTLLSHLADMGWHAVASPRDARRMPKDWDPYDLDGVAVVPLGLAESMLSGVDIVLVHAGLSPAGSRLSQQWGATLVSTIHGGDPGWGAAQVQVADPALAIANSNGMAYSLQRTGRRVAVLRPPVWPEEHAVARTGQCATLVNLSELKGAELFWKLARSMPHQQFLAVRGGYGQQIEHELPNVEIVGPVADMRDVWARTRVLLMPSREESWGMVAVEAMASGIPVLASDLPGPREMLGGAGRLLPRDDVEAWRHALLHATGCLYEDLRRAAIRRSAELHPASDLMRITRALEELSGQMSSEHGTTHTTFENVRTGDVERVAVGTRLHRRLSGLPLIWRVIDGDVPPLDEPAEVEKPPKASATRAEWAEYAIRRGAPAGQVAKATKATLVALYGE